MSKARSPRDVCSTTMGTSGLMLLALFRSSIRIPAGGPHGVGDGSKEPTNRLFADSALSGHRASAGAGSLRTRGPELLSGAFRLALVGRPQLVADAGLLGRDRLGVVGEELDRGPLGQVLADLVEPARLLEALAELLRRDALARGRRLQRVEHVAVGGLDVLGLHHGGDHGLAADRLRSVGMGVAQELLLALARHLQVDV